jgi:mono/diheme cytochrome c family protein
MFARMPTAVLAIAAALSCLGPPAEAQTAATLARGRELAERSCGGCHAIDGGSGSIVQGTDVPSFRAIAGRPNQTAEHLKAFILTPHRPMPGIPLSLNEVDDIVAFVQSLR